MVNRKKLEEMEQASREASPVALADLLDVTISGDSPAQRLESYLAQVGNPYRFRVGKTPVRVSFQSGESPLSEKLKSHFLSLKSGNSS